MTEVEIIARGYRKPTLPDISSDDAPELYLAEETLHQALDATVSRLAEALGFNPDQIYTHALPEQLASLLDYYDAHASVLAATAYLESKGCTIIERVKFEALYAKFDQMAKEIIGLGYYAAQHSQDVNLLNAANRVEGLADAVEKLFGAILSEAERSRIIEQRN